MKTGCLFIILFLGVFLLGMAQTDVDSISAGVLKNQALPQVTVGGYIDIYFGYDFSRPPSKDRPYFVSSNRHNEFSINLAFVDLKFSSKRARATFRPAIGSNMGANYSAEPAIFRNLFEGNVGIKVVTNKNIWIDAGVF
ncbi:outer membrane beta-barrel protein [Rhodocytophaga rosea]|uniref:Outer membrane beta-barrel protein n=1 Tax=Rhodocytophaga rosea TaxID=2704465 RepID=A0A6C0GU66_9BACT|nr:outer membrane beta-barrel protein [Rhodocytophaga rosea]QHT71739.1 outer membrane beta-barrel protein [Rhodocytophaga rosea]